MSEISPENTNTYMILISKLMPQPETFLWKSKRPISRAVTSFLAIFYHLTCASLEFPFSSAQMTGEALNFPREGAQQVLVTSLWGIPVTLKDFKKNTLQFNLINGQPRTLYI